MTTTLTYSGVSLTPMQVLGWEQSRDSQNLEHPLIGGGRDVTITRPSLRSGTLRLLFRTEPEVIAAENLHRVAPYVDLVSDERTLPNMRYVTSEGGRIDITLNDDTRDLWELTVDYREVI